MSIRPKTTPRYPIHAEYQEAPQRQDIEEAPRDISDEEAYDSEQEREDTLYNVSKDEMRRLYRQRDPTPEERSCPLDFSDTYDSSFPSGRFNIQESVGAIFAKSWDANSSASIHCRIRARGGGERQWYSGADISFYSAPEPQTSDMNLELINQVWHPWQN